MTKEQFKAKAKEVIDNEKFRFDENSENLFNYKNIRQMHVAQVAQVDDWGDLDSAMPFMNFIDKLYEQIKGELK